MNKNKGELEMKWEYKVSKSEDDLQSLGNQGWELVSVVNVSDQVTFYFKKPLPSFNERVTKQQRQHAIDNLGNR